jgi:hypothetical protein
LSFNDKNKEPKVITIMRKKRIQKKRIQKKRRIMLSKE